MANITVNLPEDLEQRCKAKIEERKLVVSRYSMGDFVREALRDKLDGPVAPVLSPSVVPSNNQVTRKLTPSEIAAKIPGVTVGIPPEPEELMYTPFTVIVPSESLEPAKDRGYYLKRLGEIAEMEPSEAEATMKELTGGKRVPAELRQDPKKLAAWLEGL